MFALRIKYKIQRVSVPHIHSAIESIRTFTIRILVCRSWIRSRSLCIRWKSWSLRILHLMCGRCVVQIPRRPFSLVCLSSKSNNNVDIEFFFPVCYAYWSRCCCCWFFSVLCLLVTENTENERRKWTKSEEREYRNSRTSEAAAMAEIP